MAQDNSKKVTLSFTSKSKKVSSALNLRQQSISKYRDNETNIEQTVTNITDNLSNHKQKKDEKMIIPLIKHNKWRQPIEKPPPLEPDLDTITTQQQQEAINIISNNINNHNNNIILAPNNSKQSLNALNQMELNALNQMELNKVPGIEDVIDSKKKLGLDVAQRPKQPNKCEYNSMPLFNFGEALLRGMGWDNNIAIGNQYGKNQLKIPTENIIKPRPKCLGLGAVLSKKEAEHIINKRFNPRKQRTEKEKKRITDIESWTEPAKKKQKMSDKKRNSGKNNKKKHEKIKWVRNGLRVRCIKQNEYFKQKGIVNDVIDEYRVLIQMNDSVLLTLYENDIETYIPKKGQLVMILNGENKKEKGCILSKNKYQQYATVQLQHNLQIIKCHYDDICAI